MNRKLLKFTGLGVTLLLLMALIVSRGMFLGLQKGLQNKFYDFASPSDQIVIVAIDEKSLSEDALGKFEKWPRAVYAKAIDTLNEAGASAIGIDVTLPDRSLNGDGDDQLLADALTANPNVVLAARYRFENNRRFIEKPNATLLSASPALGWINVELDEDGFVRKIPVFDAESINPTEAFSLAIARKHLDLEPPSFVVKDSQYHFARGITLPVITSYDRRSATDHYSMYVNYFALPNAFARISMADLVAGRLYDKLGNPIDFAGKIVLIGPTARDLQDQYLSPVSEGETMPGVEIHANNIQTLITGKFLRDPMPWTLWLTLFLLTILNLLLFSFLRVRWSIPILIAEIFGFMVAGIIAYEFRVLLNVIYPILTALLTFVGSFVTRYLLEESERKFVEGAFGHYVNKSVVDQILKDPEMLELGGSKRRVTVYFSDIAGFTSISEKMDPGDLVKFLNSYLSEMTDIILQNQGTLDKYEGDAIMAFWGAPLFMEDHARNTCLTALENQKKLADIRQEWEAQGLPPLHARIGINTGDAIVGNIGSEQRFDYTVMGDTVNLASRLEGINKQYGTELIISENTFEEVKEDFVCRELDLIRVKGKEASVRIFELVGMMNEVSAEILEMHRQFQTALHLYRNRDFSGAKAQFEVLADDPASLLFAKRCAGYLEHPPSPDWDGVFTFDVK
jgi:adenylate cyclase